jgi:hypothetical protein
MGLALGMVTKRIMSAIFIVLCLGGTAYARDLSPPERERVMGGEVVVNEVESAAGIPGVEAIFTVRASKKAALATLTDYANFTKVFPGIDRLNVKSINKDEAVVEFGMSLLFLKISYTLSRRVDADKGLLTWSRVDGDLDVAEGSWLFQEIPGEKGLIAVYTSYVKYGGTALTNVIRWRGIQQTRNMCSSFRGYVENSSRR